MKKIIYPILFLIFLSCTNDSESDEMPDPAALPFADFTSDVTTVNTGEAVQFQSAAINAQSLLWSFSGGDPDSSTDANPVVTYQNSGSFSVSLTATNEAGNHRQAKNNYIQVNEPNEQFATYTVTFTGNWNEVNHPDSFPGPSDHFSSAVGMVHKAGAQLFAEGELASEGIENMAELGSNGVLEEEVGAMVMDGTALSYFSGGGLGTGVSERMFDIELSSDYPMVSVVSMIAPSPDWFVAAQDVVLFENGNFVETLMVEALSYDSGTDSGSTFTSSNSDTNPAEAIKRIVSAPLGNGTTVDPPMAYFTFTRQ